MYILRLLDKCIQSDFDKENVFIIIIVVIINIVIIIILL